MCDRTEGKGGRGGKRTVRIDLMETHSPIQPCYGGTTIPRLQERLPSHMDISRGSTQETKVGKCMSISH